MFKKFIISALFLFFFQIQVLASEISDSINKVLDSFDFDHDSVVSISIKDKKTDEVIYEKNAFKFLNPASTLKIFTMAASLDTLGEDYKFKTAFYKDKYGNLYLKLSSDPLFSKDDMDLLAKKLYSNYKGKIKNIYIDDSIIDSVSYPDGWNSDDFWPNSPKMSPYMVDSNTVTVDILANKDKNDIRIIQKDSYKFSFVNKLQFADTNNIKFVYDELHNTVNIEGTISSSVLNKKIPVLNPKYFFCERLNRALNKNKISFHNKFLFKKVPNDAILVAEFSRPLKDTVKYVLYTSDNIAAEMVFKAAGAKFAMEHSPIKSGIDTFGTNENAINMFYDFIRRNNLDESQIKIKDGSGVSRYNAVNVNWMTNALLKLNFDFENLLPTSGEGTLDKRMRELKGDVYFKTGTLYGASSLSGLIKTDDREYVYSSIIMSYNRNKSLIKSVEDDIVYEVYRMEKNK